MPRLFPLLFAPVLFASLPLPVLGDEYEEAPIHYWSRPATDPVAKMREDLRSGAFRLPSSSGSEALRAVLDYFDVPVESQVLVYSKTSAQNSRISPQQPRAIYFSDEIYVGWVQGGGIEIISYDRQLGALCYFLDLSVSDPNDAEFITRPQSCMNCHVRSSTGRVPGGVVRSVFPSSTGLPYFQAGTHTVTHATPLEDRWGGWYVTGSSGSQGHQGNCLATKSETGEIALQPLVENPTQLERLNDLINTHPYPGGAQSDVTALMILEHQIQMHNTLVAANLTVRRLRYHTDQIRSSMGEPLLTSPEGTLARVVESQARKIVEALLFKDEFHMAGDGVEGSASFADAFARNALPAADGRSLKDLRLYERLFKYRCSYTIYSAPFDHLVPWLKQEVYRQLLEALSGPEGTPSSAHLSWTERDRILTILRETKPDLPPNWNQFTDG